jgi:hypothetical protein
MATLSEAGEAVGGLSRAAESFLAFARRHPGETWAFDYAAARLPDWLLDDPSPVQPWPTFVSGEKLREVERATVEVTRLVKSIPERVFERDAKAVSEFYGLDEPWASFLITPPNGIAEGFARCDFLDSAAGFKCLEVNVSACIGGWDVRYWVDLYRATPRIAEFLAEEEIEISYFDPLPAMFSHVAGHTAEQGLCRDGSLNTALVVHPNVLEHTRQAEGHFSSVYSEVLRERGLEGKLWLCSYPDGPRAAGSVLRDRDGARIHAVIEYTDAMTPQDVFRCFKAGTATLYDGPVCRILTDKRNLAILSELEGSGLFDAEERKIIRDHVPWSRLLLDGTAGGGRPGAPSLDDLLAERERLVLKKGLSSKGDHVVIGLWTDPETWERALRTAFAEGGWLVQEHVASRTYTYYHDKLGPCPHGMVWGMFCFGSSYGGGFLRMMPEALGGGIINSARGATKGYAFEVD